MGMGNCCDETKPLCKRCKKKYDKFFDYMAEHDEEFKSTQTCEVVSGESDGSVTEFIRVLSELWPDLERETQIDIYTKLVLRDDVDRIALRILECAINE